MGPHLLGETTFQAEVALAKHQVVVLGTAANECKLPTAINENNVVGVCLDTAPINTSARIQYAGIALCIAQAAISKGAEVVTHSANGRVNTRAAVAGTNYFIVGRALEDAAAAGDLIRVLLLPGTVTQG